MASAGSPSVGIEPGDAEQEMKNVVNAVNTMAAATKAGDLVEQANARLL